MEVYRIFNKKYDPLDGTGAAMVGGRWNPLGSPAVYAAWTFEGALLEQLVHANTGTLPRNRRATEIHVPDDAPVHYLDPNAIADWEKEAVSQLIGGEWLARAEEAALVVPSFVAKPWGWNVLLNPMHPDFVKVTVVATIDVAWDARLGSSPLNPPVSPSA